MLMDLVMNLVIASDKKEKEKAYRALEKVGVDRRTANVMAKEFYEVRDSNEQVAKDNY